MQTPGVGKKLQTQIRNYYKCQDWSGIADDLGITLKSVQHMLNPKSPRELTFHFIGLLAVKLPEDWDNIRKEI